MTTGEILLLKMAEEKRSYDFLKLKPESFIGSEVKLYKFIAEHFQQYNVLPSLKTIQTKYGIDGYDEYTESYTYYYREYQSRFVYNVVNQIIPTINLLIENKDGHKLLQEFKKVTDYIATTIAATNRDTYNLHEVFELTLQELQKRRLCNGITGIPTSWASLDTITHGFQKGDVFLVVARVKIGKTACMIHMVSHAQKSGYRPMFISMEMNKIQIGERLLCLNTGLNINHIRSGELTSMAEELILAEIVNQKENLPPFYYLEGQLKKNINEVSVLIENYQPDIVFIDGAYLLESSTVSNQKKWEQVADVINAIKTMSIQFNIPIVPSYQFNRQVSRKSQSISSEAFEKIQLSDAISQLASSGIAILNDPDSQDNIKLIELIGGRYGEAGAFRINWDWERMNFSEVVDNQYLPIDDDTIIW